MDSSLSVRDEQHEQHEQHEHHEAFLDVREESPVTPTQSEEATQGTLTLEFILSSAESPSLLQTALRQETWDSLSAETKERLEGLLPTFPLDDSKEKARTLTLLFNGSNFHFGHPLESLQRKLNQEKMDPKPPSQDPTSLSDSESEAKRHLSQEKEGSLPSSQLLQELLESRKKLLKGNELSLSSSLEMDKKSLMGGESPKSGSRVRKRYHREMRLIRSGMGQRGKNSSEEDDDETDGSPLPHKSPKKEVNLSDGYWKTEEILRGGVPDSSPLLPSTHEDTSRKPEDFSPLNHSENPSSMLEEVPGFQGTMLSSESLLSSSELLLLPNTPLKPNELPPSSGLTPPSEVVDKGPPVGLLTSYFSVLRDIFICHPEFKITIPALEEAVRNWEGAVSRLEVDWLSWADSSWVEQIPSAVAFLTGAFPDSQPKDFCPYIDCDPLTGNYEWIGSGRDADADLHVLKQWWFERRDVCRAITTGGGSIPPPMEETSFTDWRVRPSTDEEKAIYRSQEIKRYASPGKPFTYHVHGFSTTVGPIRGVGSFPSRAKAHVLLLPERPPCITILCLVKDAVSRLPNGEGTRTDIVELIKDSQYLSPTADPQGLTSAVSGALDRLQSEADPCVKYESIKKTWTYLHRGRSEEEFMRIHNEQLSLPKSALKPKRLKSRKHNMTFPKTPPSPPTKSTPLLPSVPQSVLDNVMSASFSNENDAHDVLLDSSLQSLLPQVPLPPTTNQRELDHQTLQEALSNSSLPPESVSVHQKQTLQLMTPQGLKTYQFTIPVSPLNKANPSSSSSLLLDSSHHNNNKSSSRLLPGKKTLFLQNPSMQKAAPPPVLFKAKRQENGEVRISIPESRKTVQRVIVKNSEGKPVQLSASSLQKLLSSGALKSSLGAGGVANKVVIQQAPAFTAPRFSQVLSSPKSTPGVRYVQLRSPLNSSPNVRIISKPSPIRLAGSNAKVISMSTQQQTLSEPAFTRSVNVPLNSSAATYTKCAAGGELLYSSSPSTSSKSQVFTLSQPGPGGVINSNQETHQVIFQSSNGKSLFLSQEALGGNPAGISSNFQNVRILQSHHQSSISPDGKILTRIVHPGSTLK